MAEAPPIWTVFSGTSQRSSSALAALIPKRVDSSAPPPAAPASPPDLDAIAAAARAEGRREGEALVAQAVQAAIAAERNAGAAGLAEARQRWVDEESAVLAAGFVEQVRALETQLARSLTQVLQPFLAEALRQAALTDLHATVSSVVADDRSGTLAVTGPADLVEALAKRLDLPPGRLVAAFDGGPDLRIRMNGTVIETQLQAWGERVATLVEDR
ncbi:hypothetical protein MKK67_00160 [Methylobacterium sp. J-072]|uniref:hypothetical protein n=1 Tax=Methylobacterium sp. J-072 TaxID=2836651 RepID=UPI001FB9FD3A|nr:hypothetical protein [Methylobacterium sp. J-072]MCJ2090928.1 hypothetical protein [Methylobacterium sp. J-072]